MSWLLLAASLCSARLRHPFYRCMLRMPFHFRHRQCHWRLSARPQGQEGRRHPSFCPILVCQSVSRWRINNLPHLVRRRFLRLRQSCFWWSCEPDISIVIHQSLHPERRLHLLPSNLHREKRRTLYRRQRPEKRNTGWHLRYGSMPVGVFCRSLPAGIRMRNGWLLFPHCWTMLWL